MQIDQRLRILLVCDYFPPVAPGGAEWSIYYLAEALASSGCEVAIATLNHGPRPEPPRGVTCFEFPFPIKLRSGQNIHRTGILENPLFYGGFTGFLLSVIRSFRPDIVHSQTKNSLPPAVLACKLRGIPVVHTMRDIGLACPLGMCFLNGNDTETCSMARCVIGSCSQFFLSHYYERPTWWNGFKLRGLMAYLWLDTTMKRWCLKHVAQAISPSEGLLKALPSHFRNGVSWRIIPHLPPPRPEVAPAKEALSRLPLSPGQRYVAYSGKLSFGKGLTDLEQAIRQIAPEFPDVKFLVFGKGKWTCPSDLPILQLGSVDHDTALRLLSGAEFTVVPSRVPEAFNRVVLESMALGRPVVVSDAGSLPDQIRNGVDGIVVKRGAPQLLAAALRELLSNRERTREMGENARSHVRNQFSAAQTVQAHLDLYQTVDMRSDRTLRWGWINEPLRLVLKFISWLNVMGKRLSIHLVVWTRKSPHKLHPKHFLANDENHSWHLRHLGQEDEVLDIGAGVGTHSFSAATVCKRVVGVELSAHSLDICRKRLKEKNLSNVRFEAGNANGTLPFPDHEFTAVILLDVIEHIHERVGLLKEIHRVLKPDGRLILTAPNRLTRWKRDLQRVGLFYYADSDHKIEYSIPEIVRELSEGGFVVPGSFGPIVYDTRWAGLIDVVGGFSLTIYRKLAKWKITAARKHPQESSGFQIVALKRPVPEQKENPSEAAPLHGTVQ